LIFFSLDPQEEGQEETKVQVNKMLRVLSLLFLTQELHYYSFLLIEKYPKIKTENKLLRIFTHCATRNKLVRLQRTQTEFLV
jgi:hypothetical protein